MATQRCARGPRAIFAVGVIAAGLTFVPATTALADPAPPPPTTSDEASAGLADLGHQAEIVNEQELDAQIAVDTATRNKAGADAAELTAQQQATEAKAAAKAAAADASELVASSYQGGRTDPLMAMMTSTGPQDMLDKMSGLDWLAGDAKTTLQKAQTASQAADRAADKADRARDDAARSLDQANRAQGDLDQRKKDLAGTIAVFQTAYDRLDAQEKAAYAEASAPAEPAPPAPAQPEAAAPAPAPAGDGAGNNAGNDVAAAPAAPAPAPQQAPPVASSAPAAAPVPAVSASGSGAVALRAALSKVGSPYAWGAAGPTTFDCSGLTSWSYAQAGVSIPRSSRAQSGSGTPVSRADLRPGDLVFFYSPVSHVGIYAGNGMVVHAPTGGQTVKVAPMSQMPYNSARRF